MRSILRGTAAGMGAAALLWGATACTGGEEEPAAAESSSSQQGGGSPGEDAQPSDGGGETRFSDAELDAASQRFLDLLQVIDDHDWESACGMVLDPTTGSAPEGERLQDCVDGVEPVFAAQAELLEPGAFDALDASMIQASDNGDGTVSLSVLGNDLDIPMAPGDDGRWYLVIPF
ncbi:hypothetical protein CFK39_00820 [Brachybacterium avium]|uniref:Secreted protein n=1 Tax=Brachybacterium avium TaxID=2017485 RepID=A0A220UFR8_9MICO|nr:hypothetical protein [Brachybacterium avium]ASK66987.1 hypothetical protein CFK39_00820 [Brachybacterium avium]